MAKFDSSIGQDLADEEPTMAVVRISLAAHQGDAVAMCAIDEALDSGLEWLLFGHRSVQGVALCVVVLLACWPAAELLAHEHVAHATLRHGSLKLITVEVRRVARVRKGPHIDEDFDPLPQDEPRKFLELVVRVPYGPNSEARRHRRRHGRDRR